MRAHASAVFEEMGRSLELRALPPARFRPPVRLSRRAEAVRPVAAPRSRRGMGIFTGVLALTSVAVASWNAYWLAAPLRQAVTALLG